MPGFKIRNKELGVFVLRCTARLDFLPKMMGIVKESMQTLSLSSKIRNKIELSVEEALVNIIHYAYPGKEGLIEINCDTKGKNFIVIIKDWGVPFDPKSVKPTAFLKNSSLNERKVGGLGVFFMYELMDEVSYTREREANVLKLVKAI